VNWGSDVVVVFCTASTSPDSSVGEADSVRELSTLLLLLVLALLVSASISEALLRVVEEGGEVRSKDTTVLVN
jgi:hypothetical protein